MTFILIPSRRRRIRMLLEMENITPEQQQRLWHLATNVEPNQAERFANQLIDGGGRYKYTEQEVNKLLGVYKPFWKRILGVFGV